MADTLDVTIDPKLVAEAQSLGIDVGRELSHRLRESIDRRKRQIAWQTENRKAIEAWNDHLDKHGLWYEHFRDE